MRNHIEDWVLGPPGTGKTSFLIRQVPRALENGRLMIASFTRAAAAEIRNRSAGEMPSSDVGTLHSFAYRALDRPTIADTCVKEFNEVSHYTLTGGKANVDDGELEPINGGQDDATYLEYQRLRALMVPPEGQPPHVREFGRHWENWKEETGYIDFTDMIERCLDYDLVPPADYVTGFFDETQDFTPLEIALVRRWAQTMDHIVLAGDDDQAIYAFKGGDPSAVFPLNSEPDNRRVLSQSHRLCQSVYNTANEWIEMLDERQPKIYKPTDEEGETESSNITWRNPLSVVNRIEDEGYDNGSEKSLMILASCSYMLDPIVQALRERGIRFHNPYSTKNGKWNPIRSASGVDRLRAYLRPGVEGERWERYNWTWLELEAWTEDIRASTMHRGMKKRIRDIGHGGDIITPNDLADIFTQETLNDREFGTVEWFKKHLLGSKEKRYEYPLRIHDHGGLDKEPNIVIGTIHSVKGGEADHVLLFPDLSRAGFEDWWSERRSRIIRQFYVGMTRARSKLIVGTPSFSNTYAPIGSVI